MPEMDGFAVAENIRKDSALDKVVIMMLTSSAEIDDAARRKQLDISAFMRRTPSRAMKNAALRLAWTLTSLNHQ